MNHFKNLIIPRLIKMQKIKIHIFANIRECMSISILLFMYRALLKNEIYCPFNKRIQGKKFLHRISSEHVKKNAKTIYKERKVLIGSNFERKQILLLSLFVCKHRQHDVWTVQHMPFSFNLPRNKENLDINERKSISIILSSRFYLCLYVLNAIYILMI